MGQTVREWQEIVDEWIRKVGGGYWPPLVNLARVTEEVGELARVVSHEHGPKRKKPSEADQDLAMEMCDIIFALICMANSLDIDLEDSFERMMRKYWTRDRSRYIDQCE